MKKLIILARFNFKTTVQSKGFLVITLVGPFLILAMTVLPGVLAEKSMAVETGTYIGLSGFEPRLQAAVETGAGDLFQFRTYTDREALRTALLEEHISGAVAVEGEGFVYLSRTATDIVTFETMKGIVNRMVVEERLTEAGLDAEYIRMLNREPQWEQQKASKEEGSFLSYLYTALGFVMLLYMTTLLYGQMIGRSVVVEKTSKTVEVMLSSVRPSELMFGKILGLGVAGLLQYLFWILISLVLILFVGPLLNISVPASITPVTLGFLLLFFVLAFFLYASLYAAIGAAAEDEQHLGTLSWPLIIFLVLPMIMISTFVASPDGTLSIILSFFPLTAPTVMLIRVLVQMPAVWEIVLFLVIMIASILAAVVGGGKIFRLGILMSGKKMSPSEVLKLLRA